MFQAEDGIRAYKVTGVQTCALPILVITPSEHVSELYRSLAPELDGRVVAWPAGVDSSYWTPQPARRNPKRSEERRVGEGCRRRGCVAQDRQQTDERRRPLARERASA